MLLVACGSARGTSVVAVPEDSQRQPAINRANQYVGALVKGDLGEIQTYLDDHVIMVGPTTLTPVSSKQAAVTAIRDELSREKRVYFHLRQARSAVIDAETHAVVANYEEGIERQGKLTETNGKVLFVLVGASPKYRIAAQVVVPNVNAGTYGPMGTAITSRPWGRFPARAVPQPSERDEADLKEPWQRELFELTKKVNATFPKDSVDAMLSFADDKVSIWAGDYGPVYIWGVDEARNHFADFFKTGKMRQIRAFNPVIRNFGGAQFVYFQFEETLEVEGQLKRMPGQATYLYRAGAGKLMACTETANVRAEIGDPY